MSKAASGLLVYADRAIAGELAFNSNGYGSLVRTFVTVARSDLGASSDVAKLATDGDSQS